MSLKQSGKRPGEFRQVLVGVRPFRPTALSANAKQTFKVFISVVVEEFAHVEPWFSQLAFLLNHIRQE